MIKLIMTGRLGKDAEQRFMANGTPVLNFSVASDVGWKERKHTVWVECSIFGKRAESLAPYLTKGLSVTISGDGDLREWEGKDGQKGKALSCNVNDVEMHGGGEKSAPKAEGFRDAPAVADDFVDSDIPF